MYIDKKDIKVSVRPLTRTEERMKKCPPKSKDPLVISLWHNGIEVSKSYFKRYINSFYVLKWFKDIQKGNPSPIYTNWFN